MMAKMENVAMREESREMVAQENLKAAMGAEIEAMKTRMNKLGVYLCEGGN